VCRAGALAASDYDYGDFWPISSAARPAKRSTSPLADNSILDALRFNPAEIVHSLLERFPQMGTAGFRRGHQQSNTRGGGRRLSASEKSTPATTPTRAAQAHR